MRLYTLENERLYLNALELDRFLAVARRQPSPQRLFALTLAYTGCRISEALELRFSAMQLDTRVMSFRTLKKRDQHHIREVPMSVELAAAFGDLRGQEKDLVWSENGQPIARITAYRWIKTIMLEAQIAGPRACPKGLRHGYGVRAVLNNIPLNMLQLWMGHASMRTTAIYATVLGPEQLSLADRMWVSSTEI